MISPRAGLAIVVLSVGFSTRLLAVDSLVAECLDELKERGVSFVSGESRGHDGARVVNRVWRLNRDRSCGKSGVEDVWCMQQRRADDSEARSSLLAISVVKGRDGKAGHTATFLQLRPGRSGTYNVVHPQAPCLMCHSNGPRAIRPEQVEGLIAPDAAGRALLLRWNREIASMGEIDGYDPRGEGRSDTPPLHLLPEGGGPELKAGMCADCHRKGSGIRSPLRLENEGSIRFLTSGGFDSEGWWKVAHEKAHAMPRERDRFTKAEMACLTSWLESSGRDEGCFPKSNGPKGKLPPNREENLNAEAKVMTTLGSFDVKDIRGNVKVKGHSSVTGDLILEDATTGISLRDRRMRDRVIGKDRRMSVNGALKKSVDSNEEVMQLRLGWKGRVQEINIPFKCDVERQSADCLCHFENVPLSLSDFGIEPPKVLWAEVQPVILLKGTLRLKKEACPRRLSSPLASH